MHLSIYICTGFVFFFLCKKAEMRIKYRHTIISRPIFLDTLRCIQEITDRDICIPMSILFFMDAFQYSLTEWDFIIRRISLLFLLNNEGMT